MCPLSRPFGKSILSPVGGGWKWAVGVAQVESMMIVMGGVKGESVWEARVKEREKSERSKIFFKYVNNTLEMSD